MLCKKAEPIYNQTDLFPDESKLEAGKKILMSYIAWSPKYSVGIQSLDEQHQYLVKMVNHLYAALNEGKGEDSLDKVFNGLVSYTIKHFAHEEQLMQRHGYPGLTAHKAEHQRLTAQGEEFIKQRKAGQAMLSVKLAGFLKNWLLDHIAGSDKSYGPYLQQQGVL